MTHDFDIPPPSGPEDYGAFSGPAATTTTVDLKINSAASLAGKAVPARPWLVPDIVPENTVTLGSGDGGVGKSLLFMQLGVAVAAGTDWIGLMPEFGTVLYVSAEDDDDEIHRRLVDITTGQGIALADLGDFHTLSLAGQDAVMGAPEGRSGLVAATPLWNALIAKVARLRPRLLILDNLADVFAGNENSRPEARQFIGLLRGVAIEHSMAVLLIAHPSLTGLSSGSGTSGSTAWSNSVRSRLYLDRAKGDGGDEPDPDLRILRVMKANYAQTGTEVRMRWEKGRFRPDGSTTSSFDRMAADAHAESTFLSLLSKLQAQDRDVSAKPSPSYAPKVFANHPDASGVSKRGFERAMERLMTGEKIKTERFGPPSKERSRIIMASPAS